MRAWHFCKQAKVFAFPVLIGLFVIAANALAQAGSATRMNDARVRERIDALIKQMTLEEKALLKGVVVIWRRLVAHPPRRPAADPLHLHDGRPARAPKSRRGRPRPLHQRARDLFPDRFGLGLFLGYGAHPASGYGVGRRSPSQRCADPVGPRHQHETLALGRPQLRVFFRRPPPGG